MYNKYFSSHKEEYHVYWSFSREDSSKTLVFDLYDYLGQKEIKTFFLDETEDENPYVFSKSNLVVVVVSKSYPSSVLCLNELQRVINSNDKGEISVLPVFYGVDPSNVRKQTGEFAEHFRKFGGEFLDDKVQAWRNALTKLTNILGLDSRYWRKDEKVTNLIINEIMSILREGRVGSSSAKPKGVVGMDRQMQVLYDLLDFNATKEVRLISIWGLGGIGKTTLARYAYEQLSTIFHTHLFVENSKNVSTDMIKSTVKLRKALLVIDSVDDIEQLEDIADIVRLCDSGSRVILVTKDKNLLVNFGVEHFYQVKSLRYDEALELFSQSAFDKQNPPTSFQSLSLRAVHIANLLPLTLKILGSSLKDKNVEEWETELQKLEGDQGETILKIIEKS